MPPVFFATESYQSRNLPLSAQRCVNMFWERQKPEAKSQVPLFGVPGMTAFATCGTGPVRGMWVMNNGLYVVSGENFYAVAENGIATQIGTGIFGNRPVAMSDNGSQIVIVNGSNGWVYDAVNGLNKIINQAFYPANTVTFFDDYFIFDRADTNQWFISNLLDGTSYNGLDFASVDASSKPIVGIAQNVQLLYIFSQDHFEVWYDAGTADFPFMRYTGGVVWRGCAAPLTLCKSDMAIFFLGDDLSFYMLKGNEPVRVSTHPIDAIIKDEPDIEKAFCFTYSLEGHKFINLTLPTSKVTLVFDATTQVWHERKSWDSNKVDLGRWRANCCVDAYGETMLGDAYDGVVSKLDWSVYTERGNTIQALLHSSPFHSDKQRVFIPRLELDMETGTGLTTGQGSDPQVMLRISRDGGKTWGHLQPGRSLGKIGEFTKRLRWLRLGVAYVWVFEITISDNVRRNFIAAHVDQEVGM